MTSQSCEPVLLSLPQLSNYSPAGGVGPEPAEDALRSSVFTPLLLLLFVSSYPCQSHLTAPLAPRHLAFKFHVRSGSPSSDYRSLWFNIKTSNLPGPEGCCWLITVIIYVGEKPNKLILNPLAFGVAAHFIHQQKQRSCTCSLHCFVLFFFIGKHVEFHSFSGTFSPVPPTAVSNSNFRGCVCRREPIFHNREAG